MQLILPAVLTPSVSVSIGVATVRREIASPAARSFADYALPRLRRAARELKR